MPQPSSVTTTFSRWSSASANTVTSPSVPFAVAVEHGVGHRLGDGQAHGVEPSASGIPARGRARGPGGARPTRARRVRGSGVRSGHTVRLPGRRGSAHVGSNPERAHCTLVWFMGRGRAARAGRPPAPRGGRPSRGPAAGPSAGTSTSAAASDPRSVPVVAGPGRGAAERADHAGPQRQPRAASAAAHRDRRQSLWPSAARTAMRPSCAVKLASSLRDAPRSPGRRPARRRGRRRCATRRTRAARRRSRAPRTRSARGS